MIRLRSDLGMDFSNYDVVVIGSGNAGLSTAISAKQNGKSVIVIEKAPISQRGGNSSLTMNFRFCHQNLEQLVNLIDDGDINQEQLDILKSCYKPYSQDEFIHDVMTVNKFESNESLVNILARESLSTIQWMHSNGHRWVPKDRGNIMPSSLPIRIKDRGKGLQQRNFEICKNLGIEILYGLSLEDLSILNNRIKSITVRVNGILKISEVKNVVIASGGYQANEVLRKELLGPKWANVSLRGVPFNEGEWYSLAKKHGLGLTSGFGHCHSTPQSLKIPPFRYPGQNSESQSSSRYCFNEGVTINKEGERFFNEGKDYPNFLYADVGSMILEQTDSIAFQVFSDVKVENLNYSYFMHEDLYHSKSISALCRTLGIDENGFRVTIESYNNSVKKSDVKDVNYKLLDGKSTMSLPLPKSNWANFLSPENLFITPVKVGLTFTYGGLSVTEQGQVLAIDGEPVSGLYACGECMGGIHVYNYVGGTGLTIGAVFGKIIGETIGVS